MTTATSGLTAGTTVKYVCCCVLHCSVRDRSIAKWLRGCHLSFRVNIIGDIFILRYSVALLSIVPRTGNTASAAIQYCTVLWCHGSVVLAVQYSVTVGSAFISLRHLHGTAALAPDHDCSSLHYYVCCQISCALQILALILTILPSFPPNLHISRLSRTAGGL